MDIELTPEKWRRWLAANREPSVGSFHKEWQRRADMVRSTSDPDPYTKDWYEWGHARRSMRYWVSPQMRAAVRQRDGAICGICGGDIPDENLHIDHVVPCNKGGRSTFDNLQVAHAACNIRKGDKVPDRDVPTNPAEIPLGILGTHQIQRQIQIQKETYIRLENSRVVIEGES